MARSAQIDVAVRFSETDLMGVAHHAAWVTWLEMGRLALIDGSGLPYTEIARTHHLSVVSVSLRIRRPLVFGDVTRITTVLDKVGSRKVCFTYELHHKHSGVLVGTGATEHVCVDLEGRSSRLPDRVVAALRHEPAQPR
ncbi:MAG: acyl-CoA thioesterase [Caldilineaceae bacterium SB0662_bin_9]|uniref:Acyl-CoA thioesterase n=1 Tax=Caldilineaceae bacterium SB0662_bin_9 TaxID=2605258 RepID=A0A6B1DU13_9CHLR|nr:acyl-CoA thioesterase [Caldilineaceae bacterium SB0666_bin_21]MYD90728.1 acyl-CoA thioesterase [Caldilineaceae bacterium SB0662_bin_9]